jgi:hypothetical protein
MADPVTALTPAPLSTITASQPLAGLPHTQPSFDPIELLPERAQDLLRKLRQRSVDAHAVIPPFEDIREASATRVAAENVARRLQAHAQDGGFNLPDDDMRVVEAKKVLTKATDDLRRLQERASLRAATWQAASVALVACEDYLRDGRPPGTALEVVETEPPKPVRGENGLLDQIENRRRRVRELRADLHRIESAPFPSSYCKQRMVAQIEALAVRGAPNVANLIEHDGKIEFATLRVQAEVFAEKRALAFSEQADALALFAWLHKDALIKRLDAEIDAESDDAAALSHADREVRTAEVMGDLLAVERDEAWCVWRAIDERLPVEHRSDISPLALLQCRLVTAGAPVYAAGGVRHSWDMMR